MDLSSTEKCNKKLETGECIKTQTNHLLDQEKKKQKKKIKTSTTSGNLCCLGEDFPEAVGEDQWLDSHKPIISSFPMF